MKSRTMVSSRHALLVLVPGITLLVLSVPACQPQGGGGGGGSTPNTLPAGGTVRVPEGTALELTGLKVLGCLGQSNVEAEGAFSVQMPAQGPAMVCLVDEQQRLLLLGFVDAADPEGGEITAKTTAVSLLYRLTGLCFLPADYREELLEMLEETEEAQTVADVIAARMAADPAALWNRDPDVVAAVTEAVSSLYSKAGVDLDSVTLPVVGDVAEASPVVQYTVAAAASGSITIPDGRSQSGVSIHVSEEGSGVILENGYRRHCGYYAYQTGYEDKDGNQQPLDRWKEVKNGYLPSVIQMESPLQSLLDLLSGEQQAWEHTFSDVIPLPLEPADAQTTYYTIVVIGPALRDKPGFSYNNPDAAKWFLTFGSMAGLTFTKDLLVPLVGAFLPSQSIGFEVLGGIKPDDWQSLAGEVVKIFLEEGVDVVASVMAGDYKGLIIATIENIAANEAFAYAVVRLGIKYGLIKLAAQEVPHTIALRLAENVVVPYALVEKLMTVLDVSRVTVDTVISEAMILWEVESNSANVRIWPEEQTVAPEGEVVFSGHSAAVGQTRRYHWAIVGNWGYLQAADQQGNVIVTSETTSVTYHCNEDAEPGEVEEIMLEVFVHPVGGEQESLGTDKAVAQIVDQERTFEMESFSMYPEDTLPVFVSVDPPFPDDADVTYEWSCAESVGTLTSEPDSPLASFEAGEDPGIETVNMVVKRRYKSGREFVLWQGGADINVIGTKTYELYGTGENETFGVDDNLEVYLGTRRLANTWGPAGQKGPLPFEAEKGDVITIQILDSYGACCQIQELWIRDEKGNSAQVHPGWDQQCGHESGDRGVQFTITYTIPF